MSELLSNIVTPQDLKALIMEVRRYARWLAQASIKARVSKSDAGQQLVISSIAIAVINTYAGGKNIDSKMLDSLIAELEAYEAAAPHIVITLAGVPGNALKQTLASWCRQNVHPSMLVDIRFNATILGGMVVQHGSHVYDWSFRRQILTARSKFPEVLRRV